MQTQRSAKAPVLFEQLCSSTLLTGPSLSSKVCNSTSVRAVFVCACVPAFPEAFRIVFRDRVSGRRPTFRHTLLSHRVPRGY